MKKLLLIATLLCFGIYALQAQTLPSVTSATVNEIPADSSSAGGQILEIILPSLDNVDKLHISLLGSGNSLLQSQVYDLSALQVWERGTKTSPAGFAVYVPVPVPSGMSLMSAGSTTVKVELADTSGNKGTPTIATDNN